MLIAAKSAASAPSTLAASSVDETWSMPPMMMMPLIAFVTLISGVWSAAVTLQMTCQPTKHARMKTVECWSRSDGAKRPATKSVTMTTIPPTVVPHARRVGERMSFCAGFASGAGGTRGRVDARGGGATGLGAGRGKTSPACVTSAGRMTSSSRST